VPLTIAYTLQLLADLRALIVRLQACAHTQTCYYAVVIHLTLNCFTQGHVELRRWFRITAQPDEASNS
jgi:hypothetical protein